MRAGLEITELAARVGGVSILNGVDLVVPFGELHVIMGPNGSGKSTLCHVLMGKADYDATGSVRLDGEELMGKGVDERARLGLLEAFQYPIEVPGVTLTDLFQELDAAGPEDHDLADKARAAAAGFGMEPFMDRDLNVGLSGGEKKRSEIFQLAVLQPRIAVLDEIDSGLDVDAVREVAEAVEAMRNPDVGVLLITHYNRILQYLTPDRVHVMIAGGIVRSGGPELADELEDKGYADFIGAAA